MAPGLPCEEKEGRRIWFIGVFLFFYGPAFTLFVPFLLLGKINDSVYLQEVQQGQKGLEDPLHHGDPRDQQGQGYQQVQVHPKTGIDTKASVSKKNETAYLWF